MYGVNPPVHSGRYMDVSKVAVPPTIGGPDAALTQASWDEPDRFAALYDRYAAQLYRYACRRVGPAAAEDVVAEAFLAAFRRRRSYDPSRPEARPWLFGILTRELGRHARAERAHYRTLARSVPATGEDGPADLIADRVSAGAARPRLVAALAALPARGRERSRTRPAPGRTSGSRGAATGPACRPTNRRRPGRRHSVSRSKPNGPGQRNRWSGPLICRWRVQDSNLGSFRDGFTVRSHWPLGQPAWRE